VRAVRVLWTTSAFVVSSRVLGTPAPGPSFVFVDGDSNRRSVFDERLAGMPPFCGAG
jgi:hypothetical protein